MEIFWVILVLIIWIGFGGWVGYVIGQSQAQKTSRQPVDRQAAAALFGNNPESWSRTTNGWKIGPVKEVTTVKTPPWYVQVKTYETGGVYVSGVMRFAHTGDLYPGESMELIAPVGYQS